MTLPNWSSLHSLGASRLLQTSYLWFLLVPILVKAKTNIESRGGVTVGGHQINFHFDLPFSWELFFYGAVFASLAHLIYLWKCPNIIKHFPSYSDFVEQGREKEQVRKEFELLLLKQGDNIRALDLKRNVEEYIKFCVALSPEQTTEEILETPWLAVRIVSSREIKPDKVSEAFWFVRNFAETMNKPYKLLCFWSYAIALILILSVALQNIWFVIRYSINTHIGA